MSLICHRSLLEELVAKTQSAALDISHIKEDFGGFYGDGYTWDMLEKQVVERWSRAQIVKTAQATNSAWFDYRHLHPGLRAHMFYAKHNDVRAAIYEKFFAKSEKRISPLEIYSLRNGRASLYITLMLLVDEAGLPYDAFFKHAYTHLLQESGFSHGWKREGRFAKLEMPPEGLLFRGETFIAAQAKFDRANLTKLYLPKHSSYKAANWRGTPFQQDFVKWACSEAKRRGGNFHYALKALIDWGYVHEREVLRRFGPDTVKAVRSIVE